MRFDLQKEVARASLLAVCSSFSFTSVFAAGNGSTATLSYSTASQVTKNVYRYIATRPEYTSGNKMLEGQHIGGISDLDTPSEWTYEGHVIVANSVNRYPAMVGTRYDSNDKRQGSPGPYVLDLDTCKELNLMMIKCWNEYGTIVHVNAVPRNPWDPLLGRAPTASDNTNNRLNKLYLDASHGSGSTDPWVRFWADMDTIAAALKDLDDQGIPVVFRPFPEFNQTNKWFYQWQQGSEFIELWRDVHYYLTNTKGLKNLIFCWEAWVFGQTNAEAAIENWWPEDGSNNCVDIVAGAFYFRHDKTYFSPSDNLTHFPTANDTHIYTQMLSYNRPFAAAQYGLDNGTSDTNGDKIPDDDADGVPFGDHADTLKFMEVCPQLTFAYYWADFHKVELHANKTTFVLDAKVATQDDLLGTAGTTLHTALGVRRSDATNDGWVLESNETSGVGGSINNTAANLRTGDNVDNKQYRIILSFDTTGIPTNAVVVSAVLRLKKASVTGTDPFTVLNNKCIVDIKNGAGYNGNVALEIEDFNAGGIASADVVTAGMSAPGADSWSCGYVNAAGLTKINTTGTTQFRVYFSIDDDGLNDDDFISWYSGNNLNADKPQLLITYEVPLP